MVKQPMIVLEYLYRYLQMVPGFQLVLVKMMRVVPMRAM